MASEIKRGLVRILANYTRLISNVLMGLVAVRILLHETGPEGFGLIAMLGATTGVAGLAEETVSRSMVGELSVALQNKEKGHFTRVFNTATFVSAGMACFTLCVYGLIYALIPVFEIEPHLLDAARWIVMFKAMESFCDVLLSPVFNMYVASERMMGYNAWVIAQRTARLMAAVWLVVALDPGTSVADALKTYAVAGAAMYIGVTLLAVLTMMLFVERRTIPRPWLARRSALQGLVKIGKWNMLMTFAQNLHLRADQIITNLFFGLIFNSLFGWAMQLTSYVRMLTVGMTDGLDAATARLSASKGIDSVRQLIRHSTRLHAFVALPTGIGVMVLAEPILRVWLGVKDPEKEAMIVAAVPVMQIVVCGTTARAVGDGWIRVLYGAGHIRTYARPIALWSVMNPILAIVLIKLLPSGAEYLGPPIAFGVVMVSLSAVLVPVVGARCLHMKTSELVRPAVGPAIMALVSCPVLLGAMHLIETWNLAWLALTCAVYAACVTTLCVMFVMTREERTRFGGAIARRLRPRSPNAAHAGPTSGPAGHHAAGPIEPPGRDQGAA